MTEVRATNTPVCVCHHKRQPKGLALRICLIADRVGEAIPARAKGTILVASSCESAGVERGDSQFSEIDHSKPVKAGSLHVCASIRRKCKTPSRVSTETNVWTDALQRVRQKLAGRIFLACQWDCRLVEVRSLSEDSETSSLSKWRVILILARCTAVWPNCSLVSSCVKPKAQLRTAFGVARIEMMPWQTEF